MLFLSVHKNTDNNVKKCLLDTCNKYNISFTMFTKSRLLRLDAAMLTERPVTKYLLAN